MAINDSTNIYNAPKYVVDINGTTPYTQIGQAINAAIIAGVPAVIYVRPGNYSAGAFNNAPNLYIVAEPGSATITGAWNANTGALATYTFHGFTISNTTSMFSLSGNPNMHLKFRNCTFNLGTGGLKGYIIETSGTWTGSLLVENCEDNSPQNAILSNTQGQSITIKNSTIGKGSANVFDVDGSTTALIENSTIGTSMNVSGSVNLSILNSKINRTLVNGGTATTEIFNSNFDTGSTQAITHNSSNTLTMSEITVDSTNNPAIGGTGTIDYSAISFLNDSNFAGTLTLNNTSRFSVAGLNIVEGSNGMSGVATLVGGTVTVNTTAVTANSRIQLTHQNNAGTPGFVSITARVPGTSFTITSASGSDVSDIGWLIINPQ